MQPRRSQLLKMVLALAAICLVAIAMARYRNLLFSCSTLSTAEESDAESPSGEAGIPCIIHQSWKTRTLPSPRATRWRSTWLKCLPNCRHYLWTDADNRDLVKRHYSWLLNFYDKLKSGVQRADLVRYLYLLHFGGIYADLDTVCLKDFRPLLNGLGLAFGGMDGQWISSVNGSYVQNSFMASRPKHPFWIGLLHRIVRRLDSRKQGGAEESTGPLIMMAELKQYLADGHTDVRIFPPIYFNPFSWITNRRPDCKTHGAMSDSEEATCIKSFAGAYVVQMHSKSWAGGKA
ncbi:hypothetical protein BOX15_Mlig018427g2 [Macrostomum lignano]|uniref:Alpha-1,4-N-acetylglucosaminyltransferase n=1 Tax=Macrostomum lignano TaxID=282301 RepID=A0A267DNA2_9PLAT|nr:hypothetical protein BOX15_Mlig018427g2 [Macrostomum lignano]